MLEASSELSQRSGVSLQRAPEPLSARFSFSADQWPVTVFCSVLICCLPPYSPAERSLHPSSRPSTGRPAAPVQFNSMWANWKAPLLSERPSKHSQTLGYRQTWHTESENYDQWPSLCPRGHFRWQKVQSSFLITFDSDFIYLFLVLHTGYIFPIYGRAPAPPQGYGARREPTPPPSDTVGDVSPEAGRHRGSNPGHPDHRTDALPTAPLEPHPMLVLI